MLTVVFSKETQKLIASGLYEIVKDKSGILLPIVKDPRTGKIIELGRMVSGNCSYVNPLIAPAQIATQVITGSAQMIQTHRGFQKTYNMLNDIQSSVSVLQSTTALIGVGTITGVALSAVNLHQTLKLREDIKQLRLEVKNGFIDLKQTIEVQQKEIIDRIEQVAKDVEYKNHQTILIRAYGRFVQALNYLKDSFKLLDDNLRNASIINARGILHEALADYNSPLLLEQISSAGLLRRKECAWAIDQTITITYQLQNAHEVVSDRILNLQDQIRQDSLQIIDTCHSEDELDFLFPELVRIYKHDLAILKSWQINTDWVKSLSPEEKKFLMHSDSIMTYEDSEDNIIEEKLEEEIVYEQLKLKSHFQSCKDWLKLLILPRLRQQYEAYIRQQAINSPYKALALENMQEVSDLTLSNLFWYFKNR